MKKLKISIYGKYDICLCPRITNTRFVVANAKQAKHMKSAKRYAFAKNTHNISKLLQDQHLRLRCQYKWKLQKRSTSAVAVAKHTHHIQSIKTLTFAIAIHFQIDPNFHPIQFTKQITYLYYCDQCHTCVKKGKCCCDHNIGAMKYSALICIQL